jgi:23S rRNA (uridine2552-2'-O)-methyltransferase
LLRAGGAVLDLGAWPGGWLQVAAEAVGPSGKVVGVDLVAIDPMEASHVSLITGNVSLPEVQNEAFKLAEGKFDVVLSDMSPKLTGIKEVDRNGALACADLAWEIATKTLAPEGVLVVKVFKSAEAEQFVKTIRPRFNKVVRSELDATRKTSNEFYVVATGYRG